MLRTVRTLLEDEVKTMRRWQLEAAVPQCLPSVLEQEPGRTLLYVTLGDYRGYSGNRYDFNNRLNNDDIVGLASPNILLSGLLALASNVETVQNSRYV